MYVWMYIYTYMTHTHTHTHTHTGEHPVNVAPHLFSLQRNQRHPRLEQAHLPCAPLCHQQRPVHVYVCMCVCVCVVCVHSQPPIHLCVCVCVCVCVWESQRPERERHEQRKLLQTPSRTHGARTQLCRYPPARRRPKHDLPSCLPAVCCRQHGQQWGTGSVVSRHRRGCRFPCPPTLPTDWPCGRRSTGRNSQQSVP